jgi:hypothetical protein
METRLSTPRLGLGRRTTDKRAEGPKEVIARLVTGTTVQIVDDVLFARQF